MTGLPPGAPLTPSGRGLHAALAVIGLIPWVVGPFVEATRERATLLGLEGPKCPSTLIPALGGCPGCGLTRGVALVFRGAWEDAFAVHPGAALILLLCAGGALVHGHILAVGRMTTLHLRLLGWGRWACVAGLLGGWLVRLLSAR